MLWRLSRELRWLSHLQQAVKTSENFICEFYGVHAVDSIYK
jgi:hypothetical protein